MMKIYHGSDKIIKVPDVNRENNDNDYGAGFYTTLDINKARDWSFAHGTNNAFVNCYTIDTSDLKIVNLDEYGTFAWIAEILYNRGIRSLETYEIAEEFVKKYKVDLSDADIVTGYRANGSYLDVIDSFLKDEITVDEVEKLFKQGELGEQVFIKSEKAFHRLHFENVVESKTLGEPENDYIARQKVFNYINTRKNAIKIQHLNLSGITATEAAIVFFQYDKNNNYYVENDDYENINEQISQNKGVKYYDT